jgi:hypothetical protein
VSTARTTHSTPLTDEAKTETTMNSTSEITVADAIESGDAMIRVLREELAANDGAVETSWAPGALRELSDDELTAAIAIAIATIPAPVNDDGIAVEYDLARMALDAMNIESTLSADDEFAVLCDERRDAWLARVENEDDTCDE